jgi:ABC-2 type transport system permease protein
MRKKLALVFLFFKTSLMTQLPYRVNFLTQALSSLFYFASGVFGLRIVFQFTESLAGWTFVEIITLLGVYQLVAGVLSLFVMGNIEALPDKVVDGHLDETLLLPENAQFLSSFGSCNVWALTDTILGVTVITGAVFFHFEEVVLLHFIQFVLLLSCSLIISYSFRMWIGTLSFWLGRTGGGFILFSSIWTMGKYPVDLYPPMFKWLLCTLVPVGIVAAVPTYALFHGISLVQLMGLLVLTIIISVFTKFLWMKGLGRYSSATS